MPRRVKKILKIEFRQKDEYLYDEFIQLVENKKQMGIKTSINFEGARLLKFGLFYVKETKR